MKPTFLAAAIALMAAATGCEKDAPAPNEGLPSPPPANQRSAADAVPTENQENQATVAQTKTMATHLRFELANETGIEFQHIAGRSKEKFMPETMGGGVAIADFNQDGRPDVLFVNSGSFADADTIQPAPHRLFINRGNGKFEDETDVWKLANSGYGMGATIGDVDNDGWPDLFLTTFNGQDRLLRNTGQRFEDVTEAAGLQSDGWSTSAAMLDLENDGDLDLYVTKYVQYDPRVALPCHVKGFLTYCTPVMFQPVQDRLYRNNGDGTFTDITATSGIPGNGKGLAVAAGDIDLDGDVDIYVANDTTANFLLINDGQGRFEDQASLLGVGYSGFGQEEAGMGADFADVNDDGRLDIVCTNFQNETTSLYVQQEQGYFIERSDGMGVGATARQRLSFGIDFFDADNDGDEDLLVANGHVDVDVHQYQTGVQFGQPNTIYERRDERLVDVSELAGPALGTARPSRGLATADLDQDGDVDYIVVNSNDRAEVVLNQTTDIGNWIVLRLEGTESNRSAIGARVEFQVGDQQRIRQLLGSSSYLSACDSSIHLGLGTADRVDRIRIDWPSGSEQVWTDVEANQEYRCQEGEGQLKARR